MATMFLNLLFFLITTGFTHLVPAAHSNCIGSQKQSLLLFKDSLRFDSSFSSKLITWNSSNCCSWLGVTCSRNGHVIDLDLSGESFSCNIDDSSSLFQLQHLQNLNLAYNDFNHSSIPAAIGKLADMRYLNLSSASFSRQIPIEVARLTKLVSLDLSGLELEAENPSLSLLFRNLTKLTELHFGRSLNLSTHDSHWCEAISSSLLNLKVLGLSDCGLRGPICESLADLHYLSNIQLDFNSFHASVPKSFANLSKLTYLDLRHSDLLGTFPKEVFQIPSLQTIDLSDNGYLHGSFPDFPNNSSLQSLTLDGTSFSGDLPNSIGNLKNISTMHLSDCNFTGSLPKSIENLTQLVDLDLSGNMFNSPISFIHWEGVANLEKLDLSNNQLYGKIPSSFASLSKLESLRLSDNRFSLICSARPPEVSNTSSSRDTVIAIDNNNLEGQLPNWILSHKNLFIVDLAYNLLATVEAPLANHTSTLYDLHLEHNQLQDIPSSYSFPELFTLNLASNKLSTIPDFLKNQSYLTYSDLSDNQIQGHIPNWIWTSDLDLLNLSYNAFESLQAPPPNTTYGVSLLDLHSNQLQGQIPLFIRGSFMDFSSNNFSGSIPNNIGDLGSTGSISLSGNSLNGAIPESICNVSGLVLDLSNNSLSGNIPQCLTQVPLSVLDLSRNKLIGPIQDNFLNSCSLKTLDFSRNQLRGQFPKSLINCSGLVALNLGNNIITDTFPCALMNISTLSVLVLRSNKFHGSIGCPNTNDTWSLLQVIDLAHNNFSGDLAGKMFQKWQAMVSSEGDAESYLSYDGATRPRGPVANYRDSITAIIKGLEYHVAKILKTFTLVDFSSNNFNGSIPKEIGELKSLYVLNLSNNAFTGRIPSSFGQMQQLESLDLSDNQLIGTIPQQMANLSFLSVLDLSNNQLVGRIPTGTQFSTFPNTSFEGNKGLWGPPLTTDALLPPSTTSNGSLIPLDSGNGIDWDLISAEIGFTCGFGLAVGSLLFCKRWRKWYYRAMRNVLFKIFPQLEERYGIHRRHVYINTRH